MQLPSAPNGFGHFTAIQHFYIILFPSVSNPAKEKIEQGKRSSAEKNPKSKQKKTLYLKPASVISIFTDYLFYECLEPTLHAF